MRLRKSANPHLESIDSMNLIQTLREQKTTLEKEIAEALKQGNERKKTLELQILKERDAEFRSGIQEVRKIMQNHHLSRQEIFNALSDQHAGKSTDTGGGGMLAEIRRFYAG